MIKFKYSVVLIALLFISCNVKKGENIELFNNIEFKLLNGEKSTDITSIIKNNYLEHINQKQVQIPLFRCIKATDYVLYIGIPYNTSILDLSKSKLSEKTLPIVNSTDSSTFDYKSYQVNSTYITEYSAKKQNNLFYVLVVAKNKLIQDSLFNLKALSQRIIIQDHDIKK